MFRRAFHLLGLPILMLVLGVSGVDAQTPNVKSVNQLEKVSDSVTAIVKTAMLKKDSALLSTVVIDTLGIVLTGPKAINGRKDVLKYAAHLLKRMGGGTLEIKREGISSVTGKDVVAREDGKYTITLKSDTSEQKLWKGLYSAQWFRNDSTWVLGRLLIGTR